MKLKILNRVKEKKFILKNLIHKKEDFYANIFKGKYLDCGTLDGYINSGLEINKG